MKAKQPHGDEPSMDLIPNNEAQGDYEIGYCKPPAGSRFVKGASGNPGGRPRGRKSLRASLESILAQRITVREGNRIRSISKVEALLAVLVSAGLKGNYLTALKVLDLASRLQVGGTAGGGEATSYEIKMFLPKPLPGEDRSYRDGSTHRSS